MTVRSHIVFAVQRICDFCEHVAVRTILCRKCRNIVGSCQNHNRSIEEDRDAHRCPDDD